MSRLTAADRMRRLLAVIPWVSGRGEVALSEISERFDYPLDRLRRDLTEVVQFVGVYPYTPDMLIEVYLDEENERVSFELADYFRSPLQLTPEEGLSLVSAGLGLLGARRGADTALERALEKIAERFDVTLGDDIAVSLGGADQQVIDEARSAVGDHRAITIDYYSLHRGEVTVRTVEPHRVFSQDGEWYLRGYCRMAGAERTFRLDRVMSLATTAETFAPPADAGDVDTFAADEDDIRVTIRLTPDAAWVKDAYPVEQVTPVTGSADLDVTLAISSLRWLERLMLQLGSLAEIVDANPALPADWRSGSVERVLARYR